MLGIITNTRTVPGLQFTVQTINLCKFWSAYDRFIERRATNQKPIRLEQINQGDKSADFNLFCEDPATLKLFKLLF